MADQTRRVETDARPDSGWGFWVGFGLLLLLLPIAQPDPPAPRGANAPASEFSAARARQVQQAVLGDGHPHPTGSESNGLVRNRVLETLQRLGYTPQMELGFACSGATCARVQNIVTVVPGREPKGPAVLLAAHYDSVGGGPGASDDVSGVATILEIARLLKAEPAPRNTIILLIDDGEEAGLLGARAFAATSPHAKEVKAIVNLEARGTSGPSFMFETIGPDDGWLVPLFARHAARPMTSSVFATVYRLMPNDTDLSVFRKAGIPGLNFAFLGHPTQYHTVLDSFANSSPASLQHHGDNALAALRGLEDVDLRNPPQGGEVWFDLFGVTVVRWPQGWTLPLALVALALVAATIVRSRPAGWAVALLALPLSFLAALALGWGLRYGVLDGAFPTPWPARPMAFVVAFWMLAVAVAPFLAGLFARRSGFAGLWAGVWLWCGALGLGLAIFLPGLSFLFLVPTLVAGLLGLALLPRGGAGATFAAIVPAVVAGLLWLPLLLGLFDGLGGLILPVVSALAALLLTLLAPLVPAAGPLVRRYLPLAALVAVLVATVQAALAPPFTPDSPMPLNLLFFQDAVDGVAHFVVRAPVVPGPIRAVMTFPDHPDSLIPWAPQARVFAAPAPPLQVPGPELTVLASTIEDGKRHVRLRLRSLRGALTGQVLIPEAASLESITFDGNRVFEKKGDRGSLPQSGWYTYTDLTLPTEGTEVEVVLGNTAPLTWYVADRSPGLPASGGKLLAARSLAASMTPIHDGDGIVLSRKVTI